MCVCEVSSVSTDTDGHMSSVTMETISDRVSPLTSCNYLILYPLLVCAGFTATVGTFQGF